MAARKNETENDAKRYIEERRRNYPTTSNIERKRGVIAAKTNRGQLLSINERIMKFQEDTGNKKTPSVLRFLKTPRYDQNIVRKVLHKEIEQEYSAILQCFRYMVKTNFLTETNGQNDDEQIEQKPDANDEQTCDENGHDEEVECVDEVIESAFDLQEIEKDEALLELEEDDEQEDVDLNLDDILAQHVQNETHLKT